MLDTNPDDTVQLAVVVRDNWGLIGLAKFNPDLSHLPAHVHV